MEKIILSLLIIYVSATGVFSKPNVASQLKNIVQVSQASSSDLESNAQNYIDFQLKTLGSELQKMNFSVQVKVDEMRTDVDEMEDQVDKVEQEVEDIQMTFSRVLSEVDYLKKYMEKMGEEMVSTRDIMKELQEQVDEMKLGVDGIKTNFDEVEGQVSEVKVEVHGIKSEFDDFELEANKMKSDVEGVENDLKEVLEDVDEVEEDVEEIKTNLTTVFDFNKNKVAADLDSKFHEFKDLTCHDIRKNAFISTPKKCMAACTSDETCQAVVYWHEKKSCYKRVQCGKKDLKHYEGMTVYMKNGDSYEKYVDDFCTDTQNNAVQSLLEPCKLICELDPLCKAAVYWPAKTSCYKRYKCTKSLMAPHTGFQLYVKKEGSEL